MILDTTFIVDHLRGKEKVMRKAEEIEESEIIKTTSITVFEIFEGLHNKKSVSEVKAFFRNIIVLDFTREAGELAGHIARKLSDEGKSIEPEDCMIASIALLENESVLTRNVKHFERVKGLSVVTY